MSAIAMERYGAQQPRLGGRVPPTINQAQAGEYFEHFINASSLKNILGYYRTMCELLLLRPNPYPLFYPKLRNSLTNWKAKALWKKLDLRASHKCYAKGKVAANSRVLIIGAGPCGLRAAIEAQLLGAKVVVLEKRDRLSRNNVLHLWPFVIEDLRMLGAKKFFGKFCAGAIDHISIRQLQCILFKVALLLGVEIHTEVSFERLIEPNAEEKTGWRAELNPKNHVVSQYEFDVILGADGKRNTLQGFKRKEFRGKLAIAITANFINKRTEAEARVEEISGVAFIFNQKFFKDLHENTGIDLENIVYYKDDTHYFVMTAKKTSLIEKGVIKQDLADTERLLAPDNVNREALMNYAKEAAGFSTNYQMPDVEFAVNHYGHPDVAMFDFTSMYAAENASKVFERNGYKLLMILVGDSLLEPFWPTGSGCARGFLSSLDAAWAIRSWSLNNQDALEVVAERESIYRLLAQTTPDNLNKDWKSYTLDPSTRYPNLNKGVVLSHQVIGQYDTDNQKNLERIRRNSQDALNAPKKRRRVDNEILINWVKSQVEEHNDIEVTDLTSIFKDGRVLCAIINHYRPDLIDYASLQNNEAVENNQTAIDILDKEIGIPPILTGEEITTTEDSLTLATYLTQVYDTFRCQTPHVKHPKLELPLTKQYEPSFKIIKREAFLAQQKPAHTPAQIPSRPSSRHKRHADAMLPSNKLGSADRKQQRKRRTLERVGTSVVERQKILEEIASNRNDRQSKRRQQRKLQTEQFIKSMQMLQANAKGDHSEPFEDYSLFVYRQTAPNFEDRVKNLEKKFTYVPDHDNKLPSQKPGTDEDFAAKIKNIEQRWYERQTVEKKPKDLMRAIGKIETSDWNIKEIEKKIKENKLGKPINRDKEKVPKWSKEEFVARQTKMEAKKNMDRQDSAEAKFADIDRNIKNLELKLKEGTSRELGTNKVATLTEKLASKVPEEPKPLQKSNSRKEVVLPTPGGSDFCHFCKKRVYLMERISAEGRFFHHTCFKCQYCNSQLRLGSYAFDRDGMYGFKFFCPQHFGMKGEAPSTKVTRKPSQRLQKSPEKRIAGVDLLDRVRTPERIEFSNLSLSRGSSDHEEEMDEDEWTDRNFGASAAEYGSSDEESSNYSDTESDDDEDAYEEALEEPATKEGTMKWAQRLNKRYSQKKNESDESDASSESSDRSSYYENSSEDEESDTATEGEEEIRARELRKQEVRVEPPIIQTDTGTDTEVVSEESSSKSSSEIHNSATEISTDSEFAHDDPTPTREQPRSFPNDMHVNKKRGTSSAIRKVNVTTGFVQKPFNGKTPAKPDIELKLSPLIPVTPPNHPLKKATLAPKLEGYALNRTQSTGGIAAKVSLELKKKYLLGEPLGGNAIQKSGSASTLDTKFKSFHTNITDCQKLLKPASEVNVAVQSVLNNDKQKPLPVENPKKPTIQEEKPHPAPPKLTTVPQIILTPTKTEKDTLDSLTSSSESTSEPLNTPNFKYEKITTPTPSNGDILSLTSERSVDKSITSEKKSLNQPKTLPDVKNADILPNLHAPSCKLLTSALDDNLSGRSSPEVPTAQLSDTELSDWARDGAVSDDMEDFKLDSEKHSLTKENVKKINLSDHICGKKNIDTKYPDSLNLETIEFMDTGSSTSEDLSDPKKGYVLFKDEDDIAQDSLNPAINEVLEAKNIYIKPQVKNTGYCHVIDKNFGGKVIDLKPSDLEILKQNNSLTEHDEDSLLIIENVQGGSTTEENTYSDSTVKAVKTIDSKIVDNKKNLWSTEFRTKTPKIADNKPKSIENTLKSIENTTKTIENKPKTIENKPKSIENKQSEVKNIEKHKITENANVNASKAIENDTTTEINATESKTIDNKTIDNKTIDNKTTDSKTTENNNTLHKKRLEDKLAQLKKEQALLNLKLTPKQTIDPTNIEFHEHCQRLQSMVEFGNAKDSIDIRKSRRKSKSDSPQKPDLIQEEKSPIQSPSHKNITSNVVKTPDLIYKREIIAKERDVNQKLIQEMVMSKMRDQHKSLERKRRNKTIASPLQSFEIEKPSSPTIIDTKTEKKPDLVLSSTSNPLSKSRTITNVNDLSKNEEKKLLSPLVSPLKDHKRPLSVFSTFTPTLSKTSACSDDFVTPVAPPRSKHDAKVTAERLKTDARARARLLSNEELGLSPEEKFQRLREKSRKKLDVDVEESIKSMVFNTERRNSFLYSNDTLNKKKNDFFRRSKSGDNENNITNNFKYSADNILDSNLNSTKISTEDVKKSRKVFQSDPNLLHTDKKKKEPKKSIKFIKIMDLFSKKSPKGLFSKISPKSKEVSKSCINLDQYFIETYIDEPSKSKSINDISSPYNRNQNNSPPPIPPLPLYYTGPSVKGTDESSDGEWKPEASSCDTIDQIEGALNNSNSSLNGKRSSHKQAKRVSRQAQLKRHRMAQEIQRKLEEAEVKTKELEERGVAVEKALRGEDIPRASPRAGADDTQGTSRDEADLMQEWFDLMRDRTELRRYERALRIQGQELELEDRHARLQHDLRERLANDCKKTQEDIDVECSIYNEMLDIVSKIDSLKSLLQEDAIRYFKEDRDFEENMLAKGLHLTPVRKTPEK